MLSPASSALIARAMAQRGAAGLHVHWRLPDGSHWSAYASSEAVKAKWIATKARLGWEYLPEGK
jgi:uncharacterized protein (DUF849 family)